MPGSAAFTLQWNLNQEKQWVKGESACQIIMSTLMHQCYYITVTGSNWVFFYLSKHPKNKHGEHFYKCCEHS